MGFSRLRQGHSVLHFLNKIFTDDCDLHVDTALQNFEPEPFADDDDDENDPDYSPPTDDHAQLSDDDMEIGVDDDMGPRAEDSQAAPQPPVAQNRVNLEPARGVDGDNTLKCISNSQLG